MISLFLPVNQHQHSAGDWIAYVIPHRSLHLTTLITRYCRVVKRRVWGRTTVLSQNTAHRFAEYEEVGIFFLFCFYGVLRAARLYIHHARRHMSGELRILEVIHNTVGFPLLNNLRTTLQSWECFWFKWPKMFRRSNTPISTSFILWNTQCGSVIQREF